MDKEIRWHQRYENLTKAYKQFKEAIDRYEELSKLEKEGLIQRFEYTFELSWKTLKDFLESKEVPANFPREVIKSAFHYEIIKEGDIWMDMLEKRNLLVYTYDEERFEFAVKMIKESYAEAIKQVFDYLGEQL
ncbi:HI0074 family nucleotidyltransferase substrate-binding subunit [Fusibacter sp. 3D3]|uniref:HI0074 family nucleotidyltransferase substrate-binding subunit n=1 Tax=Fusibacter sp. 3D3 TaxID=1048380 RepID=UPI000852E0B6|nr:HI0074 family nucleotidyltransferase substrate-binding subunit [Fusibacter sp. 3D3]GAU76357.1 nucleotidyltransferase [Fusibacter sp. 3D3]